MSLRKGLNCILKTEHRNEANYGCTMTLRETPQGGHWPPARRNRKGNVRREGNSKEIQRVVSKLIFWVNYNFVGKGKLIQ